jgi:hypothetical protein
MRIFPGRNKKRPTHISNSPKLACEWERTGLMNLLRSKPALLDPCGQIRRGLQEEQSGQIEADLCWQ